MKLSAIHAIFAAAGLPAPGREQLMQLAGTAQGRVFAEALRRFEGGDQTCRSQLAAFAHALDPQMRRRVEQLGLRFDLQDFIDLALREGAGLFEMLARADGTAPVRAQLTAQLRGFGLMATRVSAPAAVSAPAPVATPAPPYYSFKIFGAASALCVSEARTRKDDRYTVQVEGAQVLADHGRRTVDWAGKIIVQLTEQECFLALALFENLIESVRFDGHGKEHNKSLHLERQPTQYFAKLMQRGRGLVALPIRAVDALPFVSLLYKQLQLNQPHLAIDDIRRMAERMASMTPAARRDAPDAARR